MSSRPRTEATSPATPARLLEVARAAARNGYAPYSNFRVGAAVLADGKVYDGCNIENASYGLTVCAERVAVFNAISAGNRRIDAIAVTCLDAGNGSPSKRLPCGAWRQVISEFGDENTPVIVDGVGEMRLRQLLPKPFSLD